MEGRRPRTAIILQIPRWTRIRPDSNVSAADLAALAVTGARAAGPPPLPPAELGAAIEVDRIVSKDSAVHLAGCYVLAAEILGGRRVAIRIEETTLMFFDPGSRELLRTWPNPLTWDQAHMLRGARPAGPPPRPSCEPVTVQRVANNTGHHGRRAEDRPGPHPRPPDRHRPRRHSTMTIDLGGDDTRTVRLTTTQPARSIKAQQHRKAPMFPRQSVKQVLGLIRQESGGTRHADTQTRNRAA